MIDDTIFTVLPELDTKRLHLRELPPVAAEALACHRPDPASVLYFNRMQPDHTPIIGQAPFAEPFGIHDLPPWGISIRDGSEMIGFCAFHSWRLRHSGAGLVFGIARRHRNQGYMTETLGEMLAFGFQRMELKRIEVACVAGNAAAARVAEKAGMREEALLREYVRVGGRICDLRIFAALADEWTPR